LAQRAGLREILELAKTARPGPDHWLFPAALISTSLLLLAPGAALSIALSLVGHSRASRRCFIGLSSVVVLLSLLDLDLLQSIGRHVTEIAVLALQPQGHIAGGNAWAWGFVVLKWCALAVVGTSLVTLSCERLVAVVTARSSPFLRWALAGAAGVTWLMLVSAPLLLLRAWGSHPLVERLYASALVDVRPGHDGLDGPSTLDPRLRGLYARLRSAYKLAFPRFTAGKPGDSAPIPLPVRPPNVILIVTESFRHDAFGPELMPRLSRWAERGIFAPQHDSGSIYSQSGAFALLYGRSPATYHQTLDARVPPQFCTTFRNSGYECAYFTGHPKQWFRREEFLNDQVMDHFVHDDRGTWPEWDKRALDGMVQLVNTSEKPILAIVLLMSSHFEYRYPSRYEIDRPVADASWMVTQVSTLGPEARIPHMNRYRNCMRFIDDLVADAVDQLDPAKNLVVFTGDHGESIYDDGHYTHGYSFADIETRTPLAMVGPGVPPLRLDTPTAHIDVLPTVVHAISGQSQRIANVHGIDWLANERHESLLASHSPVNRQRVETQLRAAGRRLRLDLDLTRPYVTLLGFEDELGKPLPTPELTDRDVIDLATAFEDQLSVLRH
jgi:phosphoglycerol transferase MdoB-like AlkP superfamily enzyme